MRPEHPSPALDKTEDPSPADVQDDTSTDQNSGHAQLTIITATKPRRLSKGFFLDEAGALQKMPGGNLTEGQTEIRVLETLDDLAAILEGLTPSQALVYGVPMNGAKNIVTREAFAKIGRPEDATTRTNDAFAWPKGAGIMMLDYDPPHGSTPLDRDMLVQTIRDAAAGLTDAALLWWPSASSCIWHGDKELRGIRGQRLYLLVADASDIPRAGKTLVERLWLAGHGHIQISGSGTLLERTLVDASVWQTSRLDFAGGAHCGKGLDQRRGEPALIKACSEPINSQTALPELTTEERQKLVAIRAETRRAAQPDAERVREQWIEARVQEIVGPEYTDDAERTKDAEATALRALESGELAGDFKVLVEHEGALKSLSVGALLDNREKYHGCLTRDPLEPDYDGSRLVGRLFLFQARPNLFSFAHGGTTYRLHRAPARIELVRGHTAEAATATIELLRRDPVLFDFGGHMVVVEDGRLHPLCEHSLAHHLGTVTQYWKQVRGDQGPVPADCDPPPPLLKQVVAQGDRRRLKPLDGVISGPTIRRDGTVLDQQGYDAETRLFLDPLGEAVPRIPVAPTLAEAEAALCTLMQPFETFPFVDAKSKGAMLAGLLTAAVRPVLPTSPAFGFDAPVQGSGKSLLAACVGALAEGRAPDVWPHTHGHDDEETRKRLFTALRTGSRALVWDNITGVLDSASMAAFMTTEVLVDRVLGKSESLRLPNRVLFLLTGNNLQLAGDLPRRVLICRIDPKTDQPFARQFATNPLAWTLDNRMSMLAAACTLIRAAKTHSKKPAPGRLASFEVWDDLVRQTVVWIDTYLRPWEFGDPMDLVREAQAADPENDALFALLEALRDVFGSREFSARDVHAATQKWPMQNPLEAAVFDVAGDRAVKSVKSLGKVLKYREGRIVRGLCLHGRQDTTSGARMYRILTA